VWEDDVTLLPDKVQTKLVAGASTPLKHGRSLRPGENRTRTKIMHIFVKSGGETLRGKERPSYLSMHIFSLAFLLFSQKFFVALYAPMLHRLHFHPQLKIQTCHVTLSTPVIFSCTFAVFLVLLSLTTNFQSALKTYVKSHKNVHKTSPQTTPLEELTTLSKSQAP